MSDGKKPSVEAMKVAEAHLVFEESSPELDEGTQIRLAKLLDDFRWPLLEALKLAHKLPRPWMDGGISYPEWESAFDTIETAIAKAERTVEQESQR